jgi:hypothetical protein
MRDVELELTGRCPDCGEDLSGAVRVWATASWISRYHTDDRLRRGIDRAIERYVQERHNSHCAKTRRKRVYALPA